MEARWLGRMAAALSLLAVAATYRTPNFTVHAPTDQVAQQVGHYAERYRRELARQWLGHDMPLWSSPCEVKVYVGNVGAGGATTFSFDRGEVFGWRMEVQGSLERILDSVLPHEVSHTVFACHFRRPLPRWADEGAATLAEDDSEKALQVRRLKEYLASQRCLRLRTLLSLTEYPHDVLPLYAQGYSLARFLVGRDTRTRYLAYLADSEQMGWDRAVQKHYRFQNVEELEQAWLAWVQQGSPDPSPIADDAPMRLAEALRPKPNIIFRAQAPDEDNKPSSATPTESDDRGGNESNEGNAIRGRESGGLVQTAGVTSESLSPQVKPKASRVPRDAAPLSPTAQMAPDTTSLESRVSRPAASKDKRATASANTAPQVIAAFPSSSTDQAAPRGRAQSSAATAPATVPQFPNHSSTVGRNVDVQPLSLAPR